MEPNLIWQCGSQVQLCNPPAPGAARLAPPLPLVGARQGQRRGVGLGQGKWGDPQIMLYEQTRPPDVQSGGVKFGGWQGGRGALGGVGRGPEHEVAVALSLASVGMGVGVEAQVEPHGVPFLACPAWVIQHWESGQTLFGVSSTWK